MLQSIFFWLLKCSFFSSGSVNSNKRAVLFNHVLPSHPILSTYTITFHLLILSQKPWGPWKVLLSMIIYFSSLCFFTTLQSSVPLQTKWDNKCCEDAYITHIACTHTEKVRASVAHFVGCGSHIVLQKCLVASKQCQHTTHQKWGCDLLVGHDPQFENHCTRCILLLITGSMGRLLGIQT